MMDNRIIMTYLQKVVLGTLWCVGSLHVFVDCDLPQLGRDLASCGTCCRMQLRAATKPTDANFVRVIKKKVQSIKVAAARRHGVSGHGGNVAWCCE